MKLTPERQLYIDGLSYKQLLRVWRFAKVGDEMMQGDTGKYWGQRMSELKSQDPAAAVRASKELGWS